VESADGRVEAIKASGRIRLLDDHEIPFAFDEDLVLHRRDTLPYLAKGKTMWADDADGTELLSKTYYSEGGVYVVHEEAVGAVRIILDDTVVK
ncbi:serine dehydratase beta chain, partial [Streptomyces sp. SP17KL33]|uniref:serine dehydratase beta chain n=1 Tax=Streptomyces sp. SP17KL33 TaxID=3002534 RepID=UPI002E7D8EF7|nr:serine dehydratase beta chain [Streptomyces sp. SP17KL33]